MKYYIAYVPTWLCYWLGDFTSILIKYNMQFLLPVYGFFMGWSLFFNDWGGLDCWTTTTQETEYDD